MTNKKKELNKNALKEFFELIRDENEGKITKEKLGSVAKELGYNLNDEELQDMIEVADPAGDGAVTYKGLAKMVQESHQEFPRLKTSIEEIRRELTTLSIAGKSEEKAGDQNKTIEQDSNNNNNENNNNEEPIPSTSKISNEDIMDETLDKSPTDPKSPTSINANGEVEADSAVVIGKVIKAQETDNRKVSDPNKAKDSKTTARPPLVVPISVISEDGRSTAPENNDQQVHDVVKDNTHVNRSEHVSDRNCDKDIAIVPVVVSPTKIKQTQMEQTTNISHGKPPKERDTDKTNIDEPKTEINESTEANRETEEEVFVEQARDETVINYKNREIHSSQSAATRFSIDAGVVTAVDAYHVNNIRSRAKKKLEKQHEQDNIDEVDEPQLDVVQETPDLEDGSEISQDSKVYIRDKTRRVRRKASLTHSHDEPKKPVVRKRSLSKGRATKSKGPVKPNDKHSVFYSGLGCALKISQLRTKQRLLYQMWQLVYDEAMMRVQQQFHYDYQRDPAPVPKEKVKPKKKAKRRSSSLDYD